MDIRNTIRILNTIRSHKHDLAQLPPSLRTKYIIEVINIPEITLNAIQNIYEAHREEIELCLGN